jgi:hypothetical protein
VPQLQEPQHVSQKEEPFVIELVVAAQGTLAEEMESFRAEALIPTSRLHALLVHLGITSAPKYRIKEVPRSGWVKFKAITESFSGSRVISSHHGPAFRVSHNNAVADATS